MTRTKNLTKFYRSLWLALVVFIMLAIMFVIYVNSEKQIDRANNLRHLSFLLADELRQSSDDLTRMVRSYVITGNPMYKLHYQEILDIRDGKQPRPVDYHNIYWDLVLTDDRRPRPTEKAIPLLELFRQAGFTEDEFTQLADAKVHSDALSRVELEAMKLIESAHPPTDAERVKASLLLQDDTYQHAKADNMRPIGEFNQLMDRRTSVAVNATESTAMLFRLAFMVFGGLLMLMLFRVYRTLHTTLGGSVDSLQRISPAWAVATLQKLSPYPMG